MADSRSFGYFLLSKVPTPADGPELVAQPQIPACLLVLGCSPASPVCAAVLPLPLLVSEQVGEQDCRPGLLVGNRSLALLGLVAEQGHTVPGAVGGDVAEGVVGET